MKAETLEPANDWQKHFCKSKVDAKWFGVAFRGRLDTGITLLSSRWEHFVRTSWHNDQKSAELALDMIILTYET